jgi:penicillin amidase
MKFVKVGISALITVALIYGLNRSWNFGTSIPPLGKFLDPFHGFWHNAEKGDPANQQLPLAGLQGEVKVVYDSLLIPHIFAQNDDDLYLTQGYISAQHRLWQMEFQTLSAAGRISEILGPVARDYDRGQRRLGMTFGAEHNLKSLEKNPEVLRAAEKFAEGVNNYINGLSYEDLPVEYKLLDYEPEPWSTYKLALVQMNFSLTLNSGESDLQFTNALSLFGKETIDLLYPDHEQQEAPIVNNPNGWKFKPETLDSVALALPDELINIKPEVKKARGVGSNNWVVNGTKTATGSPILSNDPHLSLGVPSLWFVFHLNSPNVNTMGGTLVGTPGVILGFNDSIAWGCTNAQRDLVDWYKVKFKDTTKTEYLSDGAWKPTTKVVEKINMKGSEPFYDTVIYTHHGPIRYDETFRGENERAQFAYRWISHDEAEPLTAFYLLNRAKNHSDYMKALDHHFSPAQNFVFGAVNGDIAIRVQGKYPVRRNGEGKFILDGTKTSSEWHKFIPFDQNVAIKNPPQGYLFSTNQYPVDATYPYYIQTGDYYETYRNKRINQLLGEKNGITPQDMMQFQNDNYNGQAAESLPFMLSLLDPTTASKEEKEAIDALTSWDFFNEAESVAAIYYENWWKDFYANLWDEMVGGKVALPVPSEFTTINLIKTKPDLAFYDIRQTPNKETLRDLINMTFKSAVKKTEEWKSQHADQFQWTYFKDTYVEHLLRLEPFSFHALNGGNSSILNASSHRWGPSWRMIVSLEKSGIKAWGVYPGGQSGNPGSKFYGNMMKAWEQSRPYALKFTSTSEALKTSAYFTVQFNPASK